MPVFPIPLLTPFENRSSSLAKDAKTVNGYGEFETQGKVHIVKRPGVSLSTTYVTAAAQGVVTYLAVVRVVINNKFYTTSSASIAIDAAGDFVDFA